MDALAVENVRDDGSTMASTSLPVLPSSLGVAAAPLAVEERLPSACNSCCAMCSMTPVGLLLLLLLLSPDLPITATIPSAPKLFPLVVGTFRFVGLLIV